MTVSLKFRVCDLLAEFLADALILFCSLQTARAVTAGTPQAFFDGSNDLLIVIQSHCHSTHFLSCSIISPIPTKSRNNSHFPFSFLGAILYKTTLEVAYGILAHQQTGYVGSGLGAL